MDIIDDQKIRCHVQRLDLRKDVGKCRLESFNEAMGILTLKELFFGLLTKLRA